MDMWHLLTVGIFQVTSDMLSDQMQALLALVLTSIHVSFHMNKFHMSIARGLILAPQ